MIAVRAPSPPPNPPTAEAEPPAARVETASIAAALDDDAPIQIDYSHIETEDDTPVDNLLSEREQRLPLMRSLSRRVAAAEARIAQLEAEQNVLVASLSDAEAKPDFEGVNRRLGQIQSELATVNTLWEQAASELAFLEAE